MPLCPLKALKGSFRGSFNGIYKGSFKGVGRSGFFGSFGTSWLYGLQELRCGLPKLFKLRGTP